MPDGNVLGMIGPLALVAMCMLNLWLLHRGWARLRPALLGPRAVGMVESRPDGECAVLAFPPGPPGGPRLANAVSLRLAA